MITGAASGLGAATAQRFAEGGANVVIVDQNADRAETFAARLGENALALTADVTSEDEVAAALDAVEARFGALHVVINCAGIAMSLRTTSKNGPHPLDVFEAVVRINLVGTFNVIRLAAMMMARGEPNADGERGVIINTASVAAFDGQVGQAAYAASKGAIIGMTLPLARDLERDAIRVCTIAPGDGDTPVPDDQARIDMPLEYARLAQAIVENTTLTGEIIRLDGGAGKEIK